MAEKEGSAVPPQAKGSWGSFLKVWQMLIAGQGTY